MEWSGRIVSSPETLGAKPRIAGTRISVEFLLDLLASGWTSERILDNYPQLKPDDLQTLFAFLLDCMRNETFVVATLARPLRPSTA